MKKHKIPIFKNLQLTILIWWQFCWEVGGGTESHCGRDYMQAFSWAGDFPKSEKEGKDIN